MSYFRKRSMLLSSQWLQLLHLQVDFLLLLVIAACHASRCSPKCLCMCLLYNSQVDFLLAAMRQLAAARPDLKLLLMSATLNSANIQDYFAAHIPGTASSYLNIL